MAVLKLLVSLLESGWLCESPQRSFWSSGPSLDLFWISIFLLLVFDLICSMITFRSCFSFFNFSSWILWSIMFLCWLFNRCLTIKALSLMSFFLLSSSAWAYCLLRSSWASFSLKACSLRALICSIFCICMSVFFFILDSYSCRSLILFSICCISFSVSFLS